MPLTARKRRLVPVCWVAGLRRRLVMSRRLTNVWIWLAGFMASMRCVTICTNALADCLILIGRSPVWRWGMVGRVIWLALPTAWLWRRKLSILSRRPRGLMNRPILALYTIRFWRPRRLPVIYCRRLVMICRYWRVMGGLCGADMICRWMKSVICVTRAAA